MIRAMFGLGVIAGALSLSAAAHAQQVTPPGESPVALYAQSNANAGASPMTDTSVFEAFHGQAGIDRIVEDMVERSFADPGSRSSSPPQTRCA